MKLTTKQIAMTAVMLAVCIVSQFFKNTSVFITGPIINAALVIVTVHYRIPDYGSGSRNVPMHHGR